jgi:hypothetical protein
MIIPQGKTIVILTTTQHQCIFTEGDVGYIDGYVRGADEHPYVVVVRVSDGAVDMVSVANIRAVLSN